jgi:hypothetical protein
MMGSVEEIEVVVAHRERATLRVGDVFLKIDTDQVAGQKLWFAVGHVNPVLMLRNLPYAEWAQPRVWEQSPPPWATMASAEFVGRSSLTSTVSRAGAGPVL